MGHKNIGSVGPVCQIFVGQEQISCEPSTLTPEQIDKLWVIFEHIGENWKDVHSQSKNLKSSWLEMIHVKTQNHPSYYAEYINAIYVIDELIDVYGESDAFKQLFFEYKIPSLSSQDRTPDLSTLLSHCKFYVVDEFIRMQVLAGGFKHFGNKDETNGKPIVKGINYKGYIRGSRYSNHPLARTYIPTDEDK